MSFSPFYPLLPCEFGSRGALFSTTCSVSEFPKDLSNFSDTTDYTRQLNYSQKSTTTNLHRIPRFGSHKDATKLFTGNTNESKRYYNGVRSITYLLSAVFGIWFVLLVFFALHRKRGGWIAWLSGAPSNKKASCWGCCFRSRCCRRNRRCCTRRRKANDPKDEEDPSPEEGTIDVPNKSVLNSSLAVNETDEVSFSTAGHESTGAEHAQNIPQPSDAELEKADPLPADGDSQGSRIDEPSAGRQETSKTGRRNRARLVRQVQKCRVVLLLFVVCLILCSVLFLAVAVPRMNRMINSAQWDLSGMISIMEDANNATAEYVKTANETEELRRNASIYLDEICQANNVTAIMDSVLGEILLSELIFNDLNETIYNVTTDLQDIQNGIYNIQSWWHYVVGALIIVIDIIGIVFAVGAILAWRGKQPKHMGDVLSLGLLPMFFVLVAVSYIISTYALIFSEIIADLCINNPDEQVMRIIPAPRILKPVIKWYVSDGCDQNERPEAYFIIWTVTIAGMELLQLVLQEFALRQEYTCDGTSILKSALGALSQTLSTLIQFSYDMLDVLECKRIDPLYSRFAYETVCGHGIKALASTWASLLPFVFCAFVIMTVRIAWWQVPADFVASASDTEVEKKETEKVHAVVAEEQGASEDLEAAEEEEEAEDLDIAAAVR